jgi:RNA polymerase sigma factor (sigma-70 family)
MASRPLQTVIDHLRRAVTGEQPGDLTDAQLLDAFVRRGDEAAFELLVWRHAAMVLAACRRVLRDRHEAEDAFQATFLVFVRKAACIGKGDSVGSWLHRVASRIALRARSRAAKRPRGPLTGEDVPARAASDEVLWRDLRPVLEEEVERLPEKYRRPFVLCYLEGHTNEQAARQLGCPKGTVLSRLVRGRERLRTRLARRGVVLSGGLLATILMSKAATASVPAALVRLTVKAAIPFAAGNAAAGLVSARTAAWTEGALNAMFMTRLKMSAAIALVVALTATVGGFFAQPLLAGGRTPAGKEQPRREARGETRDGRAAPQSQVQGVVKAVDAAKGTITLTLRPGRGEEREQEETFTLAKDAEVGIAASSRREASPFREPPFREGKLADLAPGALATLQLAPDKKTVESVLATGPTLRAATIKMVDAGKRMITVTITTRPSRREEAAMEEERTYAVSPTAEIGIDDGRGRMFSIKEAKLADLPSGALATLRLSVDLKRADTVVAEGSTAGGTVKSVDAEKRKITLTTRVGRGEDAGEEKTFDVAADAEIFFDDGAARRFSLKAGKLADLPTGAVVGLKLAVDQKTATALRAEGPTVHGWFKSADAAKDAITLVTRRARDGTPEEEKTFAVAKGARVVIDGKSGGLADLKADDNGPAIGLRLSLDQKVVRSMTVGSARGR